MELSEEIYQEILILTNEGERLMENGEFDSCIMSFEKALEMIPYPKYDWEATTWIFLAIGDAYFFKLDYPQSILSFQEVLKCPDGIENPFTYLRLGQNYFEIGDMVNAKENLLKAYMLDGNDIFEQEDIKYINLIIDEIKLWQN